jgi:hypothetical protein
MAERGEDPRRGRRLRIADLDADVIVWVVEVVVVLRPQYVAVTVDLEHL